MKKFLGITTIRSDYDLLSPLYRLLDDDPEIDFRLLVAGTHLSPTFGNSIRFVENDGFKLIGALETLLDSNSKIGRCKSAGILMLSAVDLVAGFSPDLLLFAGDREDVLVAAMIGGYLEIPTAHFYGGDHVKDGYIDNSVRHATSKLASYHFVSLQEHRDRLMRLGEIGERIFVVGSIALDKFVNHKEVPWDSILQKFTKAKEFRDFATVIFHPISGERSNGREILGNIISELQKHGISAFVSYPNSDPGNREIIDFLQTLEADPNIVLFKNLERETFLTIYKRSSLIIGNSSSGICEAASIPIPAINVGLRQVGRSAGQNVIFCSPDSESISLALTRCKDADFRQMVQNIKNPYGNGNSAKKALGILKCLPLKNAVFKPEDPLELINTFQSQGSCHDRV
ncbi:MAG: UDP-N-acetylglucosamine 2-epimerase (hydrolyzing) [Candidatus Riflebacteria bacterium]|nr:UDP-N-acetylglucosamine 2-epimerase (hydrolyzing) [Candidatus Riflebacteria bacterium]